ncbi:UDP-2,4-diacetamido-2,4,6-trideoxy-beta-L-altropyranose hydrolase [Methyloterricola oryzae]|uniref:UDP-2,4-diacetamido-2,4, 6-trideoxy-beta-L-altropyranose hydrolase n=1 Tax=Methyloterricola oryzae TaxID=1495050 RepID=UPI0005EBE65B|nr:UDP-2,4-diacetamido-2,4,6-trideoxy-beta-L-altropyranose hydrolase [Methyloterricola oryzae]
MRVLFRADASTSIGSGHVMRCLALAAELHRQGASHTAFICRDLPGSLAKAIRAGGHRLYLLPNNADWTAAADARTCLAALETTNWDWLVVDHYELDPAWEDCLRRHAKRVLAIDDLGGRHLCDLLLDQNLKSGIHDLYAQHTPATCRKLLGPRYALMRRQFVDARNIRSDDSRVRRILVCFGGGDTTLPLQKTLAALHYPGKAGVAIDVVLARSDRSLLEQECLGLPSVILHDGVEDMAHLMAQADLAIGAGGSSTWERCCMGLPALTVSLADNQDAIAEQADRIGVARHLGRLETLTVQGLSRAVHDLIDDSAGRTAMSRAGMALVDGLGAKRVVQAMGEI